MTQNKIAPSSSWQVWVSWWYIFHHSHGEHPQTLHYISLFQPSSEPRNHLVPYNNSHTQKKYILKKLLTVWIGLNWELLPPLNRKGFIIPILLRSNNIDISVNSGLGGSAGAANGFSDSLSQSVGPRRRRRILGAARLWNWSCEVTEDGKGWWKGGGGGGGGKWMRNSEEREESLEG